MLSSTILSMVKLPVTMAFCSSCRHKTVLVMDIMSIKPSFSYGTDLKMTMFYWKTIEATTSQPHTLQ